VDPILDLGCGTGDLAIALAERGHRVLGVDFSPPAIDTARARAAAALPPERLAQLEFRVGDALRPGAWTGRFRSAVDCGFLHLFDPETRTAFLRDLAAAMPGGGRLHLLAFAVTFPVPDVPRAVTAEEARERFAPARGWRLETVRPAHFRTVGFEPVPALAVCATRTGADDP